MRVEYVVMGTISMLALIVVVAIIVLTKLTDGAGMAETTALIALLGSLFAGLLSYVHTLSSRPTLP